MSPSGRAYAKHGRRLRIGPGAHDPLAVSLLKDDHRRVERWFREYEGLDSEKEKQDMFGKIAMSLKVHSQLEEEIFYPE